MILNNGVFFFSLCRNKRFLVKVEAKRRASPEGLARWRPENRAMRGGAPRGRVWQFPLCGSTSRWSRPHGSLSARPEFLYRYCPPNENNSQYGFGVICNKMFLNAIAERFVDIQSSKRRGTCRRCCAKLSILKVGRPETDRTSWRRCRRCVEAPADKGFFCRLPFRRRE